MTIPVYRHNQDHDDWEVASVYASDDCDSLGRSAYDERSVSPGSPDPALHLRGLLYDDTRPRVGYPRPYQTYPPAAPRGPRWDGRYVAGKQNGFIIPPPGVIFPTKNDWGLPPQDTYWPPSPPPSERPVDGRLVDSSPSPPPPPPLLLSPSSPPLKRRPSVIAHVQPLTGSGTEANINVHASPMMGPPPRYHEVAHGISPRLVEAGCQAHSGTGMSPPRRTGLSSSTSYGPGSGRMPMPRAQSSDVRYGGHASYGSGPHKDEDGDGYGYRTRTRERRPSIWRRFVRRFGPSQVQT